MYPILFRIGDFTVTSYGVMLVVAFIGAGYMVAREFRRRGWDPSAAQDIVLAAMVGGVVGSKVYWAFAQGGAFLDDPLGTLFSRGGFTFYGGLIGGILTVAFWLYWKKYPMRQAVDACAIAVPVGYMLGRVGCFLVGDDYGYPTDVPWGVAFPEGSPPTVVPVHPTQIYEILMTLPIFVLLLWQRGRGLPAGFLFFEFLSLAGVERFIVEFFRVTPELALGLTNAQWVSIALFVTGIAGMMWTKKNPAKTGAPAPKAMAARA